MTFVFRNLAWRIVILCSESLIIVWLLQVIPEILTAILFFYSCFCIGHRCWNFFTQHNFCSLTNIEELIDLRNMKTDNLKFRIDLCNLSMDCWSVTQWMIIFKGRLLKTSLIEAYPVNASLLAPLHCFQNSHFILGWFGHKLFFQTLVAINSEWCQKSFSSFLHCLLKLLFCLIGIWAETFSPEMSI